MNDSKIIVALDYPDAKSAIAITEKLDPANCKLKIGKELFTRAGPSIVKTLVKQNFMVFLDLKYHDIPNTTANACLAAADLGVWMINVHASGGRKMMQTAKSALINNNYDTNLIGVTVLTSLTEADIKEVGINTTPGEQVLRLAKLTHDCGLDGVVCSPLEIEILRQDLPKDFKLITPGIRPEGSDKNDQQRTLTPKQAIDNGSNYLVIGRPITKAKDPLSALGKINSSLDG